MFQNITEDVDTEDYVEDKRKNKFNLKKYKGLFKVQDIVLYAMSFMVSMVSFGGEFAPFGMAMFAAVCSNKVAAGIVYISCGIGTLFGFGLSGFLSYLLSSLIFIVLTLIFRPKYENEQRNEKQKLGVYVFISSFLVQALKMVFGIFLIYDLVASLMLGITTYIFYKIFVNSITVIREYEIKQAFSIEEVMGASLMIAIAVTSLAGLNVFGLSISNILSIMLVLFLGWQHGMLVGSTAGITIGVVLGIITSSSPILVAAYAISGMVAGILNKLGKIGVIIGFCLGNAVLTYIANGNTVPIITIREILIASLGLLLIPKHIRIDITDIVGKTKCLPITQNNKLEGSVDAVYKLNSVSEAISEMAQSYNEVAVTTIEEEELEEGKNTFIEELINNIEEHKDNILYEDIINNEEYILENIYNFLEEEEELTKEDLISILEKNNNYIIGLDSEDLDIKNNIEKDINSIVKVINHTFRTNKLNHIWKQKEANNKKALANQLGGVSKVISSIAEDIDEEIAEGSKIPEDKFKIELGICTAVKKGSQISGDNNIHAKLRDGKYMLAISDGMGSGPIANRSSKTVIKMLEKLLKTGFDKDISIGLINSAVLLNSDRETYATIDICVLDLVTGNIEFVKNGACPTYIKTKSRVEIVKAVSLPAGMLDKIDLVIYDKDLSGGEIIVMCSDGILDSNTEYNNKELWVKDLLENMETENVNEISKIIIQEAIDNGYGNAKDDMTVVVAKLVNIKS